MLVDRNFRVNGNSIRRWWYFNIICSSLRQPHIHFKPPQPRHPIKSWATKSFESFRLRTRLIVSAAPSLSLPSTNHHSICTHFVALHNHFRLMVFSTLPLIFYSSDLLGCGAELFRWTLSKIIFNVDSAKLLHMNTTSFALFLVE